MIAMWHNFKGGQVSLVCPWVTNLMFCLRNLSPQGDKSCWKVHLLHDVSLLHQHLYLFSLSHMSVCVCVCVCVVFVCLACVCMHMGFDEMVEIKTWNKMVMNACIIILRLQKDNYYFVKQTEPQWQYDYKLVWLATELHQFSMKLPILINAGVGTSGLHMELIVQGLISERRQSMQDYILT